MQIIRSSEFAQMAEMQLGYVQYHTAPTSLSAVVLVICAWLPRDAPLRPGSTCLEISDRLSPLPPLPLAAECSSSSLELE